VAFWDGQHWRPLRPGRQLPRRRTAADWAATAIMLLGVAALVVGSYARATLPEVHFDPQAGAAGTKVRATASGLAPGTAVQLEWDGSSAGMPRARTSNRGSLSVSFTVPRANVGDHAVTLKVLPSSGRKKAAVAAGTVLAAGVFFVASASSPSPSTPSPTATSGGATPTSAATPTATATPKDPTPGPSPSQPGPTPTPNLPSSTPAPTKSPDWSPIPAGSWLTVVDDRFDAGGVPSHWGVYDGPYGSSPHNCATPAHVQVSGGMLRMLMRYESTGRCGAGWYTAGLYDKAANSVDQRVTVRFRVISNGVVAHRIIPMRWPTGGTWPQDGEEDYCEGSSLSGCASYLHYSTSNLQLTRNYSFDLTQWNTLRFERRDHVVRAFINDMSSPVWTYVGTSLTLPDTLKHVVLHQQCKTTGCPTGQSGTEEITIDWIIIEVPAD
jgi:hypothetical protein